jgi:hypothetical protein
MEQQAYYFRKKNYIFMGIGILLIAVGFLLMAGGGSDDPTVFNDAIFNNRRLVWAPMIVLAGFAVQILAIMHTEK